MSEIQVKIALALAMSMGGDAQVPQAGISTGPCGIHGCPCGCAETGVCTCHGKKKLTTSQKRAIEQMLARSKKFAPARTFIVRHMSPSVISGGWPGLAGAPGPYFAGPMMSRGTGCGPGG